MAKQIKYGHYLHGGDYNPEQWLDRPDILQKDIEYFKKAHINTVSVGIFSWAVLEPEEGKYNFDWLREESRFCETTNLGQFGEVPKLAEGAPLERE